MAGRPRHPKKEVEDAVAYAESQVLDLAKTRCWTWRKQGHWGRLFCPHGGRDGCQVGVFGTPRDAGNHGRQIIRAVNRCLHQQENQDEDA
jgi:hypothetical protein